MLKIKSCKVINGSEVYSTSLWEVMILNNLGQSKGFVIESLYEPSDDDIKMWILSMSSCAISSISYEKRMLDLFGEYTQEMKWDYDKNTTTRAEMVDFFGLSFIKNLEKEADWV